MSHEVGGDRNDASKYISAMADFRTVPRWPNDGIDTTRRESAKGKNDMESLRRLDLHPIQRRITEMLGVWPVDGVDFAELTAEQVSFVLSLPFTIQQIEARKQQDLPAAQKHLLERYRERNSSVIDLLEKAGCKSAVHKASRDASRFPEFNSIIVPLLKNNLASDANLELLFGDVARVRGVLFEYGPMVAKPPPANSPAGDMMASLSGNSKVAAAEQKCAECGSTDKGGKKMHRCLACKSIHYCDQECQKRHWPLHRPDCLSRQGKPVPSAVRGKAERERKRREIAANGFQRRQAECHMEGRNRACDSFLDESEGASNLFLFNCQGKRLRCHLPTFGVEIADMIAMTIGLKFQERLSLGVFPDGIDSGKYSFHGTLYSNVTNQNAKVILLFTNLYPSLEPCDVAGYYIDGIFVVDRDHNGRAQWKLVPEPTRNDYRTRSDYVSLYLLKAKDQSLAIDEQSCDLGIHNPGDPSFDAFSTAFGSYMSLR